MALEKRDILLIIGVVFLMVGMLPFLAPVYAAIIAIGLYFGVRLFVKKRKQQIKNSIGEGICATCGSRVIQRKCPVCDSPDGKQGQ